MDTGHQDKAKSKALEVNEISLNYHLSHATFACEKLIQNVYKDYLSQRRKELSKELANAIRRNDKNEVDRLEVEARKITDKSKCRIFVDYVPNMKEDAGRVIKSDNCLTINLPESLVTKTRSSDGAYVYEAVKDLRMLMAHELGHIALHTTEILEIDGLQGSKNLKGNPYETEADLFANELLRLRHIRNETIYKDGGYSYF